MNDEHACGGQQSALTIYCLAGIATYPNFMEEFGRELARRFPASGSGTAPQQQLYPYGERSRGLLRQLHESRHDLLLGTGRVERSLGGGRAAETVWSAGPPSPGRLVLLAGHSAGGVAAVHAAAILMRRTGRPPDAFRIVMIGAPKCPVPPDLAPVTLYIRGVDAGGRASDPVTRLGHWGGWDRGRGGLPVWRAGKYAPGAVVSLPLLGGHPDYFRSGASYRDSEGSTNLEKVLGAVTAWLHRSG
ncbi:MULTISPECIES: hypothetical protein [Paenibacillus]|uniref:hypothetical protein n=1 Tax=Paenibacillus TaxID=44249 RepID=UPI0022B8DD02|nr:hypothetical protein [Paenibacillus caseinilyticus]MCZ8521175.1 hypothetical protein [Paenibacillus caseinilyticus]